MKPIHLAVTVGFVLFAIAVASGSMGVSVAMFTVLFTVLTITTVADPATQENPHTGSENLFRDSWNPDDPASVHYDPTRVDLDRTDSADPYDPTSIHYSLGGWNSGDPFDLTSVHHSSGLDDSHDVSGFGTSGADAMGIGTGLDDSSWLGGGSDDLFESGTEWSNSLDLGCDWDDWLHAMQEWEGVPDRSVNGGGPLSLWR